MSTPKAKTSAAATTEKKSTASASKPKKPALAPSGADIRSFFGKPGASQGSASQKSASSAAAGSSQTTAIAIDDDIEEMTDVKPVTPASPKKAAPSPAAKKTVTAKRKQTESDSEDEAPPKKKVAVAATNATKPRASTGSMKPKVVVDSDDSEDDVRPAGQKSASKKAVVVSSDDESEEEVKPKKKAPAKSRASTGSMAAKKKKAKVESSEAESSEEEKPKAKPKAKPAESKPAANKQFMKVQAMRAAGPVAKGSKEVPNGQPNCLAGLTFVFTGELSAFSRDEAVELAKRFGGRVTGSPSGKTSFVIVGEGAGETKLKAVREKGIDTLDEDGFLNLIATREAVLDEKMIKKLKEEQNKIEKAAEELEQQQRQAQKEAVKKEKEAKAAGIAIKKVIDPSDMLWTTKYAPKQPKEICGNKGNVEKLIAWLEKWPTSYSQGFTKPGKDLNGIYRAALLHGGPGIGKTTSAHIAAKMAGYTPLELNASDSRSKKLIENGANIDNRSLDGYFGGSSSGANVNAVGMEITSRTCLIMDEVDGMSAGDRGGVGALNALIKKTKIPIICIANEAGSQKLKPLKTTTWNVSFRKPSAQDIRSRIMTVCFKEKLKVPANALDQLIEGAQGDIRQVLNMLSTWKLSSDTMDFDESRAMAKLNEKYTIMNPFNVTQKVLGPYLFSTTARETLGEKMEYYFHDHSFVPLFIFENYIRGTPAKLRGMQDERRQARDEMRLFEKASASLSDGDLVDAMIHGNDQHWSLMPLHAVLSTIRPASSTYGNGIHWGGPGGIAFPQFLGQNSKQAKLQRQLAEVQIKMRLNASGSKQEVRLAYMSALHHTLVRPLVGEDKTPNVPEVISALDSYCLNREDWDTLLELGVGDMNGDVVAKGIKSATKSAFTRQYNSGDHPIAFHKQEFGKPPKKISAAEGPAPDIEDAFDIEVDEEEEPEEKPEKANDITKDKLIKQTNDKGKAVKAPAKPKKAKD